MMLFFIFLHENKYWGPVNRKDRVLIRKMFDFISLNIKINGVARMLK